MLTRMLMATGVLLGLAVVAPAAAGGSGDSFEAMRLERLDREPPREAPRPRPRRAPRDAGAGRAVASREAPADGEARRSGGAWSVVAGRDLRSTLADWCARGGWTLAWTSDYTYEMTTGATFGGNFEDAVKALIVSMRDARPSPTVEMYEPNHVLKVANQGSAATD